MMEVYAPFDQYGLGISWISTFPEVHRVLYMNCTFQISNIHSSLIQPVDHIVLESEKDILIAASKVKMCSYNTVSLNEQRRDGIFGSLSDHEVASVFGILLLQYYSNVL